MAKKATWRNTPFAKKFYHSKAWSDVRMFVWNRAFGLCERCKERGEVKPAAVVHHIVPLSPQNVGDPDISLNPNRLLALCDECHTQVHQELGIGKLNWVVEEKPRVGFDKFGNVVKLREESFDIREFGDYESREGRD